MATVTLKGNKIHTQGELPAIKTPAPAFILTKNDLSEFNSEELKGKKVILNIFVSLDTPTCATSVRTFNKAAAEIPNTKILCISSDLPFAQKRFCGAEGINNVMTLSDFRHKEFGELYGVRIIDGPLAGLLARSIVVIDTDGKVIYTQLVPEITEEPNYEAALAKVK